MLIYDLEVIKLIGKVGEERDPNYQYCEGWHDYENIGISVIGVVDSVNLSAYYFCDEKLNSDDFSRSKSIDKFASVSHEYLQNFPDFVEEFKAESFAGFNNHRFDDNVIYEKFHTTFHGDYDLLKAIRVAAYGSDSYRDQPAGYTYSLGAIASANGLRKTGHGELAPKLWQMGRCSEVIDYCLNDCYITNKILNLALLGDLIDPNTGSKLKIDFSLFSGYF